MNKQILFLWIFVVSYLPAQDIRIHQSESDNNKLYGIVKPLLDHYQRPFTLLELNAGDNPCSLQIARDYSSVCIMADESDELLAKCKQSFDLTNIVLLKMFFTPQQLVHLGDCEHFDVILALNSVHVFNQQWRQAFEAIERLGDHLIMAISSHDNEVRKYILEKGGKLLGEIPTKYNETIRVYHIVLSNHYLRRKTWLRSVMHKNKMYCIESTFENKQLIKPVSWPHGALKTTPWIAGINLCTFKMCHGVYPCSNQLKDSLLAIQDKDHTDWIMNNMIVQGTSLALIDNDDPLCRQYCSEIVLNIHQEMLDISDPKKVEHFFWNKLIKIPVSIRQTIKFMSQLFPVFSLIFDIGLPSFSLIDRYLGYGVKLVCSNPNPKCADLLQKMSRVESVYIDNDFRFDYLIERYGKPRFCNIHMPANSVDSYIKELSQPIDCISHKFDVRYKEHLKASLDHLTYLGYSRFNFSIKDIPSFVLEDNRYLGTHKDWASSADELLYEIDQFAQLMHNGETLCGYIYARYR